MKSSRTIVRVAVFACFLVATLALGQAWKVLADGPAPMFVVEPLANYVHGHHWPLGAEVTLEIDDPSNGPGIDFTDTQTVIEENGQTVVRFWPGPAFTVGWDQVVSLTAGSLQKSTTVSYLVVLSLDATLDTVSGLADPGDLIEVVVSQATDALRRDTADGAGDWRVDFSLPGAAGDEQDVLDLQPSDSVLARHVDGDGDQTAVHWPTVTTLQVAIDIKPGSEPNCFNNDGHGVIPVAILTTASFDASMVDPFSVALDGAGARVKGKSGNAGSLADVDLDGDLDLVVQIEDLDGTYQPGNTVATLSGQTYGGTAIEGFDSVCIVP